MRREFEQAVFSSLAEEKAFRDWFPGYDKAQDFRPEFGTYETPAQQYHEGKNVRFWERVRSLFVRQKLAQRYIHPDYPNPQIPETSHNYPEVTTRLIRKEDRERGVIEFVGGPLDLRDKYGIDQAWLSPVEVHNPKLLHRYSNFHVVYLGCYPWNVPENTEVVINWANETDIKLVNSADEQTQQLNQAIQNYDGKPKIIVRLSTVGSLFYPRMSTPVHIPPVSILQSRYRRLAESLGLPINIDTETIGQLKEKSKFRVSHEIGLYVMSEPKIITNDIGTFYAYGIYRPDDPWLYYEIFSSKPIESINKNIPITIRIDSGCDIGQLYSDRGCDCHNQLLMALKAISQEDGLVIHAPTQDGRGYGMNTKMETEAGKRGFPGVHNRLSESTFMEPLDTIQAAELVFHSSDHFDLRTFDGMGTLLVELGFKEVRVLTDNRRKIEGLSKSGLKVSRLKTNTIENDDLSEDTIKHIEAKHRNGIYISDD